MVGSQRLKARAVAYQVPLTRESIVSTKGQVGSRTMIKRTYFTRWLKTEARRWQRDLATKFQDDRFTFEVEHLSGETSWQT